MTLTRKEIDSIWVLLGEIEVLFKVAPIPPTRLNKSLFETAKSLLLHINGKVDYNGPLKMIIYCPACGTQHIDEPNGSWTNPPHRSHLCNDCGHIWRPADVPTCGVRDIATRGDNDHATMEPHRTGRLDFDTLHHIYSKLHTEGLEQAAEFVNGLKQQAQRQGWQIPLRTPVPKTGLDS